MLHHLAVIAVPWGVELVDRPAERQRRAGGGN